MRRLQLLAGGLALGLLAVVVPAQGSDVLSKQEKAQLRFKQLHESMQRLQAVLAKTEPEESKILASGNTYVQQSQISEDMANIKGLLADQQWDAALEQMTEVRGELKRLMDLLLDRDKDLRDLMERIKELEEFRDRVDDLIEKQAQHKEDAARAEALKKQLERIAEAKAELGRLIEEQEELKAQANQSGLKAEPDAAENMANKQGDLKKDAESLADKLDDIEKKAAELAADAAKAAEAKAGDPKSGDPKSGDPKSGDPKSGEPKSGEPKSGEPKSGEPKSGDPKSGEPKSGEPKSGEPKSGEPKSGEPKSGEPKSGEPKSGEPKSGEPKDGKPGKAGGCQSCQSASNSMGKAQDKLSQNKPENSLEDMNQALQALKKAQKELEEMAEEAKRELQSLPFEMQARKQEHTKIDTDTLAKDMEKAAEQKDGQAQQKTPGQKNVQQSVPKMKAAAGQLKEYKPGKAKQKQQDAKEDLEAAKKALEDALAQLRQELQDEVLRALEERFGAMLAKQKEISARTKVTDRLRGEALTADGGMPAAIIKRCEELGAGEMDLASEAGDALKLLEEEGTTAVFPELVAELKEDLMRVGGRLNGHKPGKTTQRMQAEIVELLKTLINALRKTIEDGEGGGCGT